LTTIVKSNGYVVVSPHTKLNKETAVNVFLFGKQELAQLGQEQL
jgi:hypothetical protein